MPYCEMCGRETTKLFDVELEGTRMELCKSCARFGKIRRELKQGAEEKKVVRKEHARENIKDIVEDLFEVVPNYSSLIKNAREKLGLSQEELAKKINMKHSTLHKIESSHMKPSEEEAKRLEKFLGIKLLVPINKNDAFGEYFKNKKGDTLTLGDIINIKIRR